MKLINANIAGRQLGVWIALIAIIFTFLAWIMQFYSLINWEGAIKLGLQSESFNGDAAERALANYEKGLALADMFWPLPLTIIAFIGVFRNKLFGLIAAMMDFAICIYFPLFFTFQKWNTQPDVALAAIFLFAIPSLIGIIGLWTSRKIFIK